MQFVPFFKSAAIFIHKPDNDATAKYLSIFGYTEAYWPIVKGILRVDSTADTVAQSGQSSIVAQ
jgi:hypothetical protein